MDSQSSSPPPAGQNGHAPTPDEVTAALLADIDTTLAAIRDDDFPEHWFQPGYLHMLAVSYAAPRVWGQMKARFKRIGGNPFDLERAVKDYRATHGITATAPPGSARAFLEALKQRVLPNGPDAAPDYGCLYLPDVTARLQQIALDDETLYLGFFQPWVREQRGLFWPDVDGRVRAYKEASSIPFTLPHVPPPLMPPLPRSAMCDPALAVNAAPWLDAYCAYSARWSPRAAEGFHEAVGLWMLSTVAARRICTDMGSPVYPVLFLAMISTSTLYAKTTTARLGRQGLMQAGCQYLLAADRSTPQALIRSMGGRVPPDYAVMDVNEQTATLERLAFAGQRGWYFEEWGGMLNQMARRDSPIAAFHELLKVLDDPNEHFSSDTIARGLESIRAPYLALLAAATPHDLEYFTKPGSPYWHDGFWPRFAFIVPRPDEAPNLARRPRGLAVMSASLAGALNEWHRRLGIPVAVVEPVLDSKGKPTGVWRRQPVALPCQHVPIDADAEDAYYAYNEALLQMAINKSVAEDLKACYGRFHEKCLRIALLLASLNDAPSLTLSHWARAQQVTEHWRLMLHQMIDLVAMSRPISREQELEDRIEKLIARDGPRSARDCRTYIRGYTSRDIQQALVAMVSVDRLMEIKTQRTKRYGIPTDADIQPSGVDDTVSVEDEEVPF